MANSAKFLQANTVIPEMDYRAFSNSSNMTNSQKMTIPTTLITKKERIAKMRAPMSLPYPYPPLQLRFTVCVNQFFFERRDPYMRLEYSPIYLFDFIIRTICLTFISTDLFWT